METGAWRAAVHRVTKELDVTKRLSPSVTVRGWALALSGAPALGC